MQTGRTPHVSLQQLKKRPIGSSATGIEWKCSHLFYFSGPYILYIDHLLA